MSTAAFAAQCAVLGLRTVRTIDQLNAAYRPLILQWHPDRHHGQAGHAIALVRATAINEAYAFLSAALERQRTARASASPVAPRESRPASHDGFPDASVLEIFVKPSTVISVGYNGATADLFVKYIGHRIYRYMGVPPTAFEALLLASSTPEFVRVHIDRQYTYEVLKRPT
ncbi:KTSC domain-containing protein [Gemmatimonas sp.]|uniref:KTSC domain-containing protein n=1 Tax=Gemmatimonas sp. TaxID=1962908 RepID=UPI0039831469